MDSLSLLPLLSWLLIDQYCQTEYTVYSTIFECGSMFRIPCAFSSASGSEIFRSAVCPSQFAWLVVRRRTVYLHVRLRHSVLTVMGPIFRISKIHHGEENSENSVTEKVSFPDASRRYQTQQAIDFSRSVTQIVKSSNSSTACQTDVRPQRSV